MDTLTVPNNKYRRIRTLIYSLSAIFSLSLFSPLRQCKTINSKGTLRSGSYTLFIQGNDKSLWCNGFWRRVLPCQTNKYINTHWGGGGGGKIDGTTRNDRLPNPSRRPFKRNVPLFGPVPSYSALRVMSPAPFPFTYSHNSRWDYGTNRGFAYVEWMSF